MAERIRFVPEIGLWALSRGRHTCKWQTSWCRRHCYNRKFYNVNPKLEGVDQQDEAYWSSTSAIKIAHDIAEAIGDAKRFRLAVRGEIWTNHADVEKVSWILHQLPDVLFWIPTRAWHDRLLRREIEFEILGKANANARVIASVDPSDDEHEVRVLRGMPWSTVFAGDNSDPNQLLLTEKGTKPKITVDAHRCLKTWEHKSGHCLVCEDGCFSSKRVDVHLKKHR